MDKPEFLQQLHEYGLEEIFGIHYDELYTLLTWMVEEDVEAEDLLEVMDALSDGERDKLKMSKPE